MPPSATSPGCIHCWPRDRLCFGSVFQDDRSQQTEPLGGSLTSSAADRFETLLSSTLPDKQSGIFPGAAQNGPPRDAEQTGHLVETDISVDQYSLFVRITA